MRLSTIRRRAAFAAAGAGIAAAVIAGVAAGVPASAAPEDAGPASLVEDFSYPDAASHPGIKLIRGDGRILIVDCDAGRTSAEVWSYTRAKPFCFEFKGSTGFVSLELADVYGIRNLEDFAMSAKVTVDESTKVVDVPEADWKGVGVGAGENQAVLLELRA